MVQRASGTSIASVSPRRFLKAGVYALLAGKQAAVPGVLGMTHRRSHVYIIPHALRSMPLTTWISMLDAPGNGTAAAHMHVWCSMAMLAASVTGTSTSI